MVSINDPAVVDEVRSAFERYDSAQLAGDQPVLDQVFWNDPHVTRCGLGETLVGMDAIRSFRARRDRPPQQRLYSQIVIATFDKDFAVLTAVFDPAGKPDMEGRWTLTWVRIDGGWRVAAAHTSLCARNASAG